MNYESKIYIAGHRGLVGSALMRNLLGKGFSRLIIRSRVELDLTNQAATEAFFAQVSEFVASNRVHEQTKSSSQRRWHYAEFMAVIKRYAGGVPLKWHLI
ncbi:MAG: NAD-dependent epimerase/dehydratase family protein [Candidatus Nitrotoga sp.]|nr:NAD-dependent epimerase/dehydratase family protein [Candidatus Nitrotoga sp.]